MPAKPTPAKVSKKSLQKPVKPTKPTADKTAVKPDKQTGAKATASLAISLECARAQWALGLGLVHRSTEVIDAARAAGWPRTLGGIDVYLALHARAPSVRRVQVDAAVLQGKLRVVPALRGCIYLAPSDVAPLLLRFAEDRSWSRTEREMAKAGIQPTEIETLGKEVLKALAKGPLAPDGLRQAMPKGTVRSLGEAGKRIGMSSPLPTALRRLEFDGKVERILTEGRLDTERYLWGIPAENPFEHAVVPNDPVDRLKIVAEHFLRCAGPVTLGALCDWAGVSQREARASLDRLDTATVTVDGYSNEAWVVASEVEGLRGEANHSKNVSFLPMEDNYLTLHGGPGILTDPRYHDIELAQWGSSKKEKLGIAHHISQRVFVVGDRVRGLWEFDPDTGRVVISSFDKLSRAEKEEIEATADRVGVFICDELGHARSFSLDTDAGVKERAAYVRGFRASLPG